MLEKLDVHSDLNDTGNTAEARAFFESAAGARLRDVRLAAFRKKDRFGGNEKLLQDFSAGMDREFRALRSELAPLFDKPGAQKGR